MSLLNYNHFPQIYVCASPVDFRRSIDGLSSFILQSGLDPGDHSLYIFTNRARNRMKMIYFDGCSAWLLYRRLHKGSLNWKVEEDGMIHLSQKQLEYLLEGLSLDSRILKQKKILYY